MKKYLLLSFLCFAIYNNVTAQNKYELKLKQYSLQPDFEDQTHILTLENLSKQELQLKLSTRNLKCEDPRTKKNSDLEHILFNNMSKNMPNTVSLKPKEIVEFSITIKKPINAILGSINCTEVIATTLGQKPIAETLIIKSFVPDPKNAN